MNRRRFALLLPGAALVGACRPARIEAPLVVAPPGDDEAEASGPPEVLPDGPGRISVGGAVITVEYEGRELPVPPEMLDAWVRSSAAMVSDYLGGFPVPSLEITLVGRGRGGVGFGMHQDGRWITVYCGQRLDRVRLHTDWVLVHEMLHAAFPDLRRDHRWMQEGLSTYLEPIVRARAGNLDEVEVWRRWTRSMHHGRPISGDRGLDITHTWGRTYWGGAMFWLKVDLELRLQTQNEKSIRDVVRGILAAGGNGRANWSTARVVEVGDEATGTTVLRDTYDAMALAPGDVDLPLLYEQLGVVRGMDGSVHLDDDAPLAYTRYAITHH